MGKYCGECCAARRSFRVLERRSVGKSYFSAMAYVVEAKTNEFGLSCNR